MNEEQELNEAQEIAIGADAERVLGSDPLRLALDRIEQRAFAAFKSADTDEKRRSAHALAIVPDTIKAALAEIKEAGARASIERARREKQQASRNSARR